MELPTINVQGIADFIDAFVAFIKEAMEVMKNFIAGFKSNYPGLAEDEEPVA